jgi:hypothetical protein
MAATLDRRLRENPFYVLGLPTTCSRADLEREGQKLLSMLALGLKEAGTYQTPAGPRERTSELVREAMAELRDPKRRVVHELLAGLPATAAVPVEAPGASSAAEAPETWSEAAWAFGFAPRSRR